MGIGQMPNSLLLLRPQEIGSGEQRCHSDAKIYRAQRSKPQIGECNAVKYTVYTVHVSCLFCFSCRTLKQYLHTEQLSLAVASNCNAWRAKNLHLQSPGGRNWLRNRQIFFSACFPLKIELTKPMWGRWQHPFPAWVGWLHFWQPVEP